MVIDTNIVIYSLNSSSPKNKKAQEFLQQNTSDITIADQNILEAIRVLTHPKFTHPMSEHEAMRSISTLTKEFQIIYPNQDTLSIALALVKKHQLKADRVFDAYFAATAISNGDSTIITDNERHFRMFEEITVFNPFTSQKN
jgi:predicted nucleic acid-binding protein